MQPAILILQVGKQTHGGHLNAMYNACQAQLLVLYGCMPLACIQGLQCTHFVSFLISWLKGLWLRSAAEMGMQPRIPCVIILFNNPEITIPGEIQTSCFMMLQLS